MSPDVALGLVLVLLFGAAVVLAAAEAALLRVPPVRVKVAADSGDRAARRLARLLRDLPRVLNSVLLVVLLVQIGAATVTGLLAERHFGNLGITAASVLLTIVLFVYAEAIPKTYAVRHPLAVARRVSLIVAVLERVLRPLVSLLVRFADLQTPGSGVTTRVGMTEEELRVLAAEAAATGAIEDSDRELIDRAFVVGDLTVERVMVPRPDIVAVEATTGVVDALDLAVKHGHRRLPVFVGDLDHIVGVVRMRELAAEVAAGRDVPVSDIARTPLVVPETKRIIEVLRDMQRAGTHLAVAVDEHGGTAGIVTIEDVVEELVGKVSDEGERVVEPVRELGEGRWRALGSATLEEVAEALDVDLPEGPWRSLGGMLVHEFGRIPQSGEAIELAGFDFRVVDATPTRIEAVEISRP